MNIKKVIVVVLFIPQLILGIKGSAAQQFVEIGMKIDTINQHRLEAISHLIFKDLIKEECFFASHYGMASPSSIAIGCSWTKSKFALLTAPGKKIYIVEPNSMEGKNTINIDGLSLNPHGFGVKIDHPEIKYEKGELIINGAVIHSDEAIANLSKER